MISNEKLFGNLFDDVTITPERLFHFGQAVVLTLTAGNGSGDFTPTLAILTPAVTAMGIDLGLVDTSLNVQKGKTITVVGDIKGFKKYMSTNYDVIAKALGGTADPRFQEFYPRKKTEYTNATQGRMETLTKRVNVAAGENSGALGTTLTSELQAFYAPWVTNKNVQETQKVVVTDNRAFRNSNFIALGVALTKAVHAVGYIFPADVATCATFFSFANLYSHGHQLTITLSGTIDKEGIFVAKSRLYTDSMSIYVKNTSIDSDLFVYLAAVSGDEPTTVGKKVKATKGTRKIPSLYGNLADTFLSLKNQSSVNQVTYIVKITF